MTSELTTGEREALFQAGDHHPDACDCTGRAADVRYEPGWGEVCGGFEDTLTAVEAIIAARLAAVEDLVDEWEVVASSVWAKPSNDSFERGYDAALRWCAAALRRSLLGGEAQQAISDDEPAEWEREYLDRAETKDPR